MAKYQIHIETIDAGSFHYVLEISEVSDELQPHVSCKNYEKFVLK